MLKISTAPHINSPQDTRSIMLDVIIALLPALAAALLIFGLGALIVVLTAVAGIRYPPPAVSLLNPSPAVMF